MKTAWSALLALGAMLVGVPYCAVSPAYLLASNDFDKLRHVLDTQTPALVYAADGQRYGRAIEAVVSPESEVTANLVANYLYRPLENACFYSLFDSLFDSLLATKPTPALDGAMQATGPDTLVKFLFTSGSTQLPKAVINTQRQRAAHCHAGCGHGLTP